MIISTPVPHAFAVRSSLATISLTFYCAKHKLVVEIDGSQHYEPEEQIRDAERTDYLNSLGLQVIRFSNHDVDAHFDSVCAAIDRLMRKEMRIHE